MLPKRSNHFLFLFRLFTPCFLAAVCLQCSGPDRKAATADATSDAWSLGIFEKADSVNPVMGADSNLVFNCPIWGGPIKWGEKDVFNPAAVVRHDTVFLLFRAEDK